MYRLTPAFLLSRLFRHRSRAVGRIGHEVFGRPGRVVRRRVRESDNVFRGEPGSGKHEDSVYGRRGWCPRKRVEKMHRGTRRAVRSVRRENEEVNRRRELDDQVRRRRRVGGLLSFTLLSFTLLAKRARVAFVLLRDKKISTCFMFTLSLRTSFRANLQLLYLFYCCYFCPLHPRWLPRTRRNLRHLRRTTRSRFSLLRLSCLFLESF